MDKTVINCVVLKDQNKDKKGKGKTTNKQQLQPAPLLLIETINQQTQEPVGEVVLHLR